MHSSSESTECFGLNRVKKVKSESQCSFLLSWSYLLYKQIVQTLKNKYETFEEKMLRPELRMLCTVSAALKAERLLQRGGQGFLQHTRSLPGSQCYVCPVHTGLAAGVN